jgi:hypothetical protein
LFFSAAFVASTSKYFSVEKKLGDREALLQGFTLLHIDIVNQFLKYFKLEK